jgi:hypothetical protein
VPVRLAVKVLNGMYLTAGRGIWTALPALRGPGCLKSQVREERMPGSVRGRSGNWPSYRDVPPITKSAVPQLPAVMAWYVFSAKRGFCFSRCLYDQYIATCDTQDQIIKQQ